MADNSEDRILVSVGLDASEANAGIQNLRQNINGLSQQDLGTTNVKSYKLQIRELTAELQRIEQVQGRNSQSFRDGAKELGRLKLAARDFKDQIEAYDPSNKLAGLANIAKGAAVGLTGAAGAMALFGIKGEKAEEALLRLQGILALSHALSSIHEITNGYRSFTNVLGLGSTAATGLATSQAAQAASAAESANIQQLAQERLAAATVAANELRLQSEAALQVARAEGLAETEGLTAAETAYLEVAKLRDAAVIEQTAAQEAYNATVVTTTEVEEVATVATDGFGKSLKLLGLGAIVIVLALIVSNFDSIKQWADKLLAPIGGLKGAFQGLMEAVYGVGNAIKSILQLNFDVLDNFHKGAAAKAAQYAEEDRKVRVQAEVEANERIIKERKALGESTYALEVKNQQLKNSILDKDADDYKKKLLDGQSEITVLQNTEIKKRQDEADKIRKAAQQKSDALKKSELDKLKQGNEAASKVIQGGLQSQRDIEISDSNFKYKKLYAIAQKYGQDSSKLREAQGIEEARINKKYADEIKTYLEKTDEETLTEFDKKRKSILKDAETALKNANPTEAAAIQQSKNFQLNAVNRQERYSDASDAAKLNLTNVEDSNRAGTGIKPDSIEVQYQKEQAIRNARLIALKADYDKEKDLKQYSYNELAQLDADYQKNSHDLEDENAKAKIALSQAEKEAKLKDLDIVGNALGAFAGILGKNTIAAKALGVAQATISTYIAASQTLADPTLPFIVKAFAVAGTIATGLAQVKNILAVKVPGASGSGSSAPSYSAPTINSTVLNAAKQGIQKVEITNQPTKQEPIKAYVVERDITSKQSRAAYLDRQSTI